MGSLGWKPLISGQEKWLLNSTENHPRSPPLPWSQKPWIHMHFVLYLKFLMLIFFLLLQTNWLYISKGLFLAMKENADPWKSSLISLYFFVYFCTSACTSLHFFEIQFYVFYHFFPPFVHYIKKQYLRVVIATEIVIYFPWLISEFPHCILPPPFFLVATGDRLDVGSSGSEKPSVAQRIIISHYFITYLLLSMIELRLSGTVRKLLFIVHRELCSYLWFFFTTNELYTSFWEFLKTS